jgi:hypothetical protein
MPPEQESQSFFTGFLRARNPVTLNALEIERLLAALVWYASSQVKQTPPEAEETMFVFESGTEQFIEKTERFGVSFQCSTKDLGKLMDKGDSLKKPTVLFVGSLHFLEEGMMRAQDGRLAKDMQSMKIVPKSVVILSPGEILCINSSSNGELLRFPEWASAARMVRGYLQQVKGIDEMEAARIALGFGMSLG